MRGDGIVQDEGDGWEGIRGDSCDRGDRIVQNKGEEKTQLQNIRKVNIQIRFYSQDYRIEKNEIR